MTERYVATDAAGIQHLVGLERAWSLPVRQAGDWRPGELATLSEGEHDLVLLDASGLLDELGERVFVAAAPAGAELASEPSELRVRAAYLSRESAWDLTATATFALDCAEHVLGEAASVELPGGIALGSLLEEARRFLERSSDVDEHRLGLLARISAAHRLRQRQEDLGEMARVMLGEDLAEHLELFEDPAWTTIATMSHALLAAVEVLRHLALPRYATARERSFDPDDDSEPGPSPNFIWTPWGALTFGGERYPAYVPAYVAAREAAERGRLAAADRAPSGPDDPATSAAAADERRWQAIRLEELLVDGAGLVV